MREYYQKTHVQIYICIIFTVAIESNNWKVDPTIPEDKHCLKSFYRSMVLQNIHIFIQNEITNSK